MAKTALRFEWRGLDELRTALRQLAPGLTGEGQRIVQAEANAAAVRIRTNYGAHVHTGKLQGSVSVTSRMTKRGVPTATVHARARHAAWFEFGTAGRHRFTKKGGGRGVMPAAPPLHAFYPVIFAARRRIEAQLATVLQRAGLEVRHAA